MKQARVLSRSELKRVLAVCSAHRYGMRNKLIVLLSHYAGLRVGEISSLKWNDLLETNGSIKAVFYLSAKNTKSNEARWAMRPNHVASVDLSKCTPWRAKMFD
jgi:integrase/recombinase XerD